MTDLNQETYDAIEAFMESRGYPPSVRELGERLGLSVSSTQNRLRLLDEAGLIDRSPDRRRLIILKETT
jgi:repressor LexA